MEAEKKTLYFAAMNPTAKIPTKTEENAGYDIYANFSEEEFEIKPHATGLVPTGIASAMSSEWYLQVEERGSTGSKGIKKSAGVIDSSYRGEIFIAITNSTDMLLVISKSTEQILYVGNKLIYPYNKAIAQLVLHRVHNEVSVKEITPDELRKIPSIRQDGALGSSGK